MNKKLLGIFQYLFFLGLGIFLLWLTLRKSDWQSIYSDLAGADYIFLIPATLMLLVSHFIRAIRWKNLMQPLGYSPSLLNTFLAVLVGYWANLAVPRLGEVLKCTILAKYEKVPADRLVGTIVAERAVDVLTLGVVFLATVVTQYDLIGEFTVRIFKNYFTSAPGGFSYLRAGAVLMVILAFILLIIWIFRRLSHLAFVIKTRNIFRGIWQGLISIRQLKNKGMFVVHSIMIWGLYLYSTYMGLFAMRELSALGLKGALSALSFGSIGMIIPSPGGIGSFQYAIQQVMMIYGVSAEKGLSLGMLIWLAQTGIMIVSGTAAFLLLPFFNKNKKPPDEAQ